MRHLTKTRRPILWDRIGLYDLIPKGFHPAWDDWGTERFYVVRGYWLSVAVRCVAKLLGKWNEPLLVDWKRRKDW